jgi:hypothetical protein
MFLCGVHLESKLFTAAFVVAMVAIVVAMFVALSRCP